MKFEKFKNEMLELINGTNLDNPSIIKLINKTIAVSNPTIRVYYNFSIQDFTNLLENTSVTEFDGMLKRMDSRKQYSIETKESLDDFIEFLIEEEDFELLRNINSKIKKINDNLFIYETGQLSPKYWV